MFAAMTPNTLMELTPHLAVSAGHGLECAAAAALWEVGFAVEGGRSPDSPDGTIWTQRAKATPTVGTTRFLLQRAHPAAPYITTSGLSKRSAVGQPPHDLWAPAGFILHSSRTLSSSVIFAAIRPMISEDAST